MQPGMEPYWFLLPHLYVVYENLHWQWIPVNIGVVGYVQVLHFAAWVVQETCCIQRDFTIEPDSQESIVIQIAHNPVKDFSHFC